MLFLNAKIKSCPTTAFSRMIIPQLAILRIDIGCKNQHKP